MHKRTYCWTTLPHTSGSGDNSYLFHDEGLSFLPLAQTDYCLCQWTTFFRTLFNYHIVEGASNRPRFGRTFSVHSHFDLGSLWSEIWSPFLTTSPEQMSSNIFLDLNHMHSVGCVCVLWCFCDDIIKEVVNSRLIYRLWFFPLPIHHYFRMHIIIVLNMARTEKFNRTITISVKLLSIRSDW